MERVLRHVPRSGRHLDVGTGRGDGTALVAEVAAPCIGLEYGLRSALLAARRGCTIARGDARRLPFAAGCFDSVTCLDVLEHVPRPREAVAELARVLRPGGVLILQTPNRELFKERVLSGLRAFGFRQKQPYDRPLPLAALRRLLAGAGFAVDEERRVRCWDDRAAVRAVSWSRLFVCRRAGPGGAG
jgi:SAM-dependent methyltransferase